MNLFKKAATTVATLGLATALILPVTVSAQTVPANQTTQTNPFTTFMQSLADHFHLSLTDLESFFQQNLPPPPGQGGQTADAQNGPGGQGNIRQSNTQTGPSATDIKQHLDSDVSSGKITSAQETALLAKIDEAKAKHEAARKLSPSECKTTMDAYRTEVQSWLTSQGIDQSYLSVIMPLPPMGGPGAMGMHRGQGRSMMQGQNQNQNQNQNQQGPQGPDQNGSFGGPMGGPGGSGGFNGPQNF